MRRVTPAPRSQPRYPTLRVAWRLLAATAVPLLPSLARADATVPGEKQPQPPKPPVEIPRPHLGGSEPAPRPPGVPPQPVRPGGKMVAPKLETT
jgi:hypothetical protein